MANIGLIIGNDRQRIEEALDCLGKYNYDVYVLSSHCVDNPDVRSCAEPLADNFLDMITEIGNNVSMQDNLLIYTTDARINSDSCLQFNDRCIEPDTFVKILDTLPYRERTVIMNDRITQNWYLKLITDSKTLFIGADAYSSAAFFHDFWNNYGHISNLSCNLADTYLGRYIEARQTSNSLQTLFIPGYDYIDDGMANEENENMLLSTHAENITREDMVNGQNLHLQPGQVGVYDLFAEWCEPCLRYKPTFANLSLAYGGQYFFGVVDLEDGVSDELQKRYEVTGLPEVLLLNGDGHSHRVMNTNMPLNEIYALYTREIEGSALPYLLEHAADRPIAASALRYAAQHNPDIFNRSHLSRLFEVAEYNTDAVMALAQLADVRYDLFDTTHVDMVAKIGRKQPIASQILVNLWNKRADLHNYIISAIARETNLCTNNNAWAYLTIVQVFPIYLTAEHISEMIPLSSEFDDIQKALAEAVKLRKDVFNRDHVKTMQTNVNRQKGLVYVLSKLKEARPDLFSS